MKAHHEANIDLLNNLFFWKQQQNQLLRYEIIKNHQNKWLVHFYAVNHEGKEKQIFASFSGKNPEKLKQWAIEQLTEFQLKRQDDI